MCGQIYLEVAKNCLENWYPDMPEKERSALLARADFEELETYIGAKSSIEAAITGFNKGCQAIRLPDYFYLPDDFVEKVIFNNDTDGIYTYKIEEICYSAAFKDPCLLSTAVVLMLNTIHDEWVAHNTKKFFDESRKEKRFMFMPLMLIGWNEARKDLIFLMPLLDKLGFHLEEEDIKARYNEMRKKFEFEELVTMFTENLQDLYKPLDSSIIEAVKDEDVARLIARQCIDAA